MNSWRGLDSTSLNCTHLNSSSSLYSDPKILFWSWFIFTSIKPELFHSSPNYPSIPSWKISVFWQSSSVTSSINYRNQQNYNAIFSHPPSSNKTPIYNLHTTYHSCTNATFINSIQCMTIRKLNTHLIISCKTQNIRIMEYVRFVPWPDRWIRRADNSEVLVPPLN